MEQTTDQPAVSSVPPPLSANDGHQEENTDQAGCLGSIWNSKTMKILRLVLFPLGLYLSDVVTDLMLAVQYYHSGDRNWFGWTLGFVILSSLVTNTFVLVKSTGIGDNESNDGDNADSNTRRDMETRSSISNGIICTLCFLQLGIFVQYFELLRLILRGRDVVLFVGKDTPLLPLLHFTEILAESIPQLYLQIYIIGSTGEQVSVLKVISMVISLVSAVKAVVALQMNETQKDDQLSRCTVVSKFLLSVVWIFTQLSCRVLAIGLFVGAFKAWSVLPIVGHWLIMAAVLVYVSLSEGKVGTDLACRIFVVPFFMVSDIFIMSLFALQYSATFWVNWALTLLGNITMVTVWYTLKVGQGFYWFHMGVLVSVVAGSVVSAVCGIIWLLLTGRLNSPLASCREKPSDQQDLATPNPGAELNTV